MNEPVYDRDTLTQDNLVLECAVDTRGLADRVSTIELRAYDDDGDPHVAGLLMGNPALDEAAVLCILTRADAERLVEFVQFQLAGPLGRLAIIGENKRRK